MKRKQIFVIACLMMMLTGTLAVAGKAGMINNILNFSLFNRGRSANSVLTKPEITYEILFRKLASFEKSAEEKEELKEDSSHLRTYAARQYDLTEVQSQTLHTIARETLANLADNERRAYIAINAFRAQFPNGEIPAGVPLPTPPPEIAPLQAEREQIVLAGRDRVQQTFGEPVFTDFETNLQRQTQAGLRPVSVDSQNNDARGE